MFRSPKTTTTVLAAFIALAVPASASAVTTISDGPNGKLVVSGSGTDNLLQVLHGNEGGTNHFQLSVNGSPDGGTLSENSSHCQPADFFGDQISECDYDINRMVVKLREGKDETFFESDTSDQPWPAAVKLVIDGGGGNDRLRGSEANDKIKGGSGKDALVGWFGSDKLLAKDGTRDRRISCGPGDNETAKTDPNDPQPRSC